MPDVLNSRAEFKWEVEIGKLKNLKSYLSEWSGDDIDRSNVETTLLSIADASVAIAKLIQRGPLEGQLAAVVGDNADGDAQKELDIQANDILIDALKEAPVSVIGSEENEHAILLDKDAPIAVNMDPLDGSSNIETNVSVGSIFSLLNSGTIPEDNPEAVLLQSGDKQIAAGFVIYGPQTPMVLTVKQGTHIFTLDPETSEYMLTSEAVRIPKGKFEYAINASNYRHWEDPLRAYIDDCISGDSEVKQCNFNMRWVGSLVAETFRILVRGGVFLYPRDDRPGYQNGRLRLLYEASPIALLVEEADGMSIDGVDPILGIEPTELHQRAPLIFGSPETVETVSEYHINRNSMISHAPLFAQRGLFRG